MYQKEFKIPPFHVIHIRPGFHKDKLGQFTVQLSVPTIDGVLTPTIMYADYEAKIKATDFREPDKKLASVKRSARSVVAAVIRNWSQFSDDWAGVFYERLTGHEITDFRNVVVFGRSPTTQFTLFYEAEIQEIARGIMMEKIMAKGKSNGK